MVAGIPLAPACARSAPKACCHCGGKAACCAAKNTQPAAEVPAAPVPGSTQNHFQAALFLAVSFLNLPPAADLPAFSAIAASPATHAVPLFTRDCAFLI